MYAEVAWVLVSSGTQVQSQVILDPDYLSDCLSVSYDYVNINSFHKTKNNFRRKSSNRKNMDGENDEF